MDLQEPVGAVIILNVPICVCGLGTIGMATAEYIKDYFVTVGYDIQLRGSKLFATTTRLPSADIYIVTVNTEAVGEVCNKIAKVNRDALICVESTVPVGRCQTIADGNGFKFLVYCPHRYWPIYAREYGVNQLRVLGALNPESYRKAMLFYLSIGIPVHVVSTLEVAELCKVAENSSRFVEIVFAEELALICRKHGLDFNEVREACNTHFNVDILEARGGIGGKCLPQDIGLFRTLLEFMPLVDGAIKANERYCDSKGV